jgi:hypothetical protein
VTGVYPAQGPLTGQTQVSVFGSGLDDGRVDFGTLPAASWLCRPTRCTATAPASGHAGPVHVTVVNEGHRSTTSAADMYSYVPGTPPPPAAPTITDVVPDTGTHLGGQQVTLHGTNLTRVSSIEFGDGFDVTDFAATSDTSITLTTPRMDEGPNDVVVFGPGGASAVTPDDVFTGTAVAPTITSISPTSGPDLGGTQVTLTGTNLTDGFVSVGDLYADSECTATTCHFTTRPLPDQEPIGPRHVQVSTSDGDSAPTAADVFTFTAGPAPEITALEPDTGSTAGGSTLVVSGHNLNGGTVRVGGNVADGAGDPTTARGTRAW